jgi:(2Fe-2S) ferredoxin
MNAPPPPEDPRVGAGFRKMNLPAARRHAFLCLGPDCCAAAEGEAAWTLLKAEVKALDLPVLRTKAACLRVCHGGPWLVVYPEGVWYGALTAARLRHIVHEHLGCGRPVAAWIARQQPLPGGSDPIAPGGKEATAALAATIGPPPGHAAPGAINQPAQKGGGQE